GFLSRKLGTTCDNVREVRIVTADGRFLHCNSSQHSDLFWACRGGGGGNFGIVTGFRFRTSPVSMVSTFIVDWPWSSAKAALQAWQAWAPFAPDELFSVFRLSGVGGGSTGVRAVGQLVGPKSRLASLISPLTSVGSPTRASVTDRSYIDAVTMWAG